MLSIGSLSISPVHDKKDHINDESFAELVLQSKQRYNEILQANDSSGEGFHDDRRSTDQIEDWVNSKLEGGRLYLLHASMIVHTIFLYSLLNSNIPFDSGFVRRLN